MSPGLCMDVNMQNNQVALWSCHGGANQNFFSASYGPQRFNGKCLDQAGPNQGAGLVMASCQDKPSQRWALISDAKDKNALGSLRNEAGWCANIPRGDARQGVQIIVWTCPARKAGWNDVWLRGALGPVAGAGLPQTSLQPMAKIGAIYVPGGKLIGQDGGSLVAQGAGNIVAPSGLVAQGAGNLVAQGAGNIVAAGAGNVIRVSGGALVAQGAGN